MVAVFLVVPIQPIDAADGLKQAVVAHLLVDVEVGGRWRIEAGEQLVHHDQELHLPRLMDELLLHLFLELFHLADCALCWLIEPVGQHLAIDAVLEQVVRLTCAGLLALGISNTGGVAGDDGALALEFTLGE